MINNKFALKLAVGATAMFLVSGAMFSLVLPLQDPLIRFLLYVLGFTIEIRLSIFVLRLIHFHFYGVQPKSPAQIAEPAPDPEDTKKF